MSSSESYPSKVLVSGELSSDGLALLGKSFDVHEYRQALLEPNLLEIIANFDALVVRSETKVTKVVLQAGRNLKVVARAGVGVDNIGRRKVEKKEGKQLIQSVSSTDRQSSMVDVAEATKLGIVVVNSPSGNIGAAAEHTIALMMAMARRIPDACTSLKNGTWQRSKFVGVEVKGKVLGIVGLGKGKQPRKSFRHSSLLLSKTLTFF